MPKFNTKQSALSARGDLLDELVKLTHCDFISNLPQKKPEILSAVQHLDAEDFTLKAWKEAILYLCSVNPQFETAREARGALLLALEQEI